MFYMPMWKTFSQSSIILKNNLYCIKLLKHFSSKVSKKEHIPSRAFLYVPASDERKLRKAFDLEVDCIVLNCEDGVALNQKEAARKNIASFYNNSQIDCFKADTVCVRVNDPNSGFFEDDMQCLFTTKVKPDMIIVPKINDPADVTKICKSLNRHNVDTFPDVVICIESATSIMLLRDICEEAKKYAAKHIFNPIGLLFGGDDYLASIGATKTLDHSEILYGRQKLVNVAKAFNLQAIDIVCTNYTDVQLLQEQSAQGARMGYTGKQIIHPAQIKTVQKCFSPSSEQIEWAKSLIQKFEASEQEGKGAFNFRGNMIDAPLMKQAQNIMRNSMR